MPVPKKRTSRARRDQRRSHHHIDVNVIKGRVSMCPKCGELKQNHHICLNCGFHPTGDVDLGGRSSS